MSVLSVCLITFSTRYFAQNIWSFLCLSICSMNCMRRRKKIKAKKMKQVFFFLYWYLPYICPDSVGEDSENKKAIYKESEVTKFSFKEGSAVVVLSAFPPVLGFWIQTLGCNRRRRHCIDFMTSAVPLTFYPHKVNGGITLHLHQGHTFIYSILHESKQKPMFCWLSDQFNSKTNCSYLLQKKWEVLEDKHCRWIPQIYI